MHDMFVTLRKKTENKTKRFSRLTWYLVHMTHAALKDPTSKQHPNYEKYKNRGGCVVGAVKIGAALPYEEYVEKYPQNEGSAMPGKICHSIERAVSFLDLPPRPCKGNQFLALVDAETKAWAKKELRKKGVEFEAP